MPAVSQAQQRLMGMVYAFKKGKLKSVPNIVKKLAKRMKLKDVKDFAKTPRSDLPTYKEHIPFAEFMEATGFDIIPYSRDLDIRNVGALPRGLNCPYLLAIRGQGSEFVAKQWKRKLPKRLGPNEVLISFVD